MAEDENMDVATQEEVKDSELVAPKTEPSNNNTLDINNAQTATVPPAPSSVVQQSDDVPKTNSVGTPGVDSAHMSLESPNQSLQTVESYRIPGYAGWFSWSKIHPIEMRSLPEFFDGKSVSKNPKLYKYYRDFIINRCKANPGKLLTFTEVRKMLTGDVNAIRRVFEFCEYWGLVNYQKSPENNEPLATAESVVSSVKSETISTGLQTLQSVTKAGNDSNHLNEKPAKRPSSTSLTSYKDSFAKSTGLDVRTINSEDPADKLMSFTCSTCETKCSKNYYEDRTKAEFYLCESCFSASESIEKDKFDMKEIKMPSDTPFSEWKRQEILRLLEAVEKYGENWDLVVQHVGTKSKADCIMQIIKMPFGDQFITNNSSDLACSSHITNEVASNVTQQDNDERNYLLDRDYQYANDGHPESGMSLKRKRESTEFVDARNPILSQVATLSSMVGPRVAVAAAQAALAILTEEDPLASQFSTSIVTSQKDALQLSGSQAVSKGISKPEDEQKGTKEGNQGPRCDTESVSDDIPSVTQLRAAIATSIGAAAANAKLLADQEEREIEFLMATVIENQLKKLSSKVKHFDELEFMLKEEHLQVERLQTDVLADCIRLSNYNYSSGPG